MTSFCGLIKGHSVCFHDEIKFDVHLNTLALAADVKSRRQKILAGQGLNIRSTKITDCMEFIHKNNIFRRTRT